MKQILILLISVILFSCSDSEIRYHIDETTSPTDTLTYLKSDMKPLNGIMYCEFGENGKYINGKKEGIHKDWYESGQISSELEYENGIRTFKKYMNQNRSMTPFLYTLLTLLPYQHLFSLLFISFSFR